MALFSKEHYEIIDQFDQQFSHLRLEKEHKNLWTKGRIYQDGNANELFLAFRKGVAYGMAVTACTIGLL